jgi:G3E family GTPase
MRKRTPITLITGSLGSGKTTLLKRIIQASGGKLAVLINEFGEIGIDGRIIRGENTRVIELAGGCVCCELAGEFVAAVGELLEKYQPDMIVLEATGVAEADALVYEVEDDLPQVRLDCVLCVGDVAARVLALVVASKAERIGTACRPRPSSGSSRRRLQPPHDTPKSIKTCPTEEKKSKSSIRPP